MPEPVYADFTPAVSRRIDFWLRTCEIPVTLDRIAVDGNETLTFRCGQQKFVVCTTSLRAKGGNARAALRFAAMQEALVLANQRVTDWASQSHQRDWRAV